MENPARIHVVGLDKEVEVIGPRGRKNYLAKIDTGADRSAISLSVYGEVGSVPTGRTVTVSRSGRRSQGVKEIVRVTFAIDGESFEVEAYKDDRSRLTRDVRVGRDILRKSVFIIIPRLSEIT